MEEVDGKFYTNPINRDFDNDKRIGTETQVKNGLASQKMSPIFAKIRPKLKKILQYFFHDEDKSGEVIYRRDPVVPNLLSYDEYAVQNIGHATLLIQVEEVNLLTDPAFYDLVKGVYPEMTESHPKIKKLPRIDAIILSHNHRDHCDAESIKEILKHHSNNKWPQPKAFVPKGDKSRFERYGFDENNVVEVEWFTQLSVTKNGKTVNIISVPCDHRSGRWVIDNHKSLVTGWIINPKQQNVIFKFAGDTRQLTPKNQLALDAVIWSQIKAKDVNKDKSDAEIEIPDIICLEPSGPNFTRVDMIITHQSTTKSVLMKFIDAYNLAILTGRDILDFLRKIKTIIMHHNKFPLGPDRYNEGVYMALHLIEYLSMEESVLNDLLAAENAKLLHGNDKRILLQIVPLTAVPLVNKLSDRT